MKLVLADLRQEALDRAATELISATIVTAPTDVSRMEDVQRLKERTYAEFGEVAVLMNNAGTSASGGPFDIATAGSAWLGIDLWGAKYICRNLPALSREHKEKFGGLLTLEAPFRS
jgi:NAD(P)-dependent dehydrogenase (short-subunit alcohol dehydrogenase family)